MSLSASNGHNLSTRISLLQLAQSGKESPAWGELMRCYRPFVQKVLIRMGLTQPDVDDVCQLVLMRLWKDLCNYQYRPHQARFRTWLSHLIHSTVVDWHRRQQRARSIARLDWTEGEPSTGETELEQQIEAEWRDHVVNLALEHLRNIFSGNAVEVFVRSVEGESVDEISEKLGLSRESVYVLKHRVKKRLVREVYELRRSLEFPQA